MKHLLAAAFVMISSFAAAQIVNFTNPVLKNSLLNYTPFVIDTNGDGEIQLSEAQAVHTLNLGQDQGVTDDLAGLESFTNLDTLLLMSWPPVMTTLNLSGFTSIRYLECAAKNLQTVNLSGCTNLDNLFINRYGPYYPTALSNLNINNTPRLKRFECGRLVVPVLDLRQQDSLETLSLLVSDIPVVDISGLTMCKKIILAGNFGFVNAENATALTNIGVGTAGNIPPTLDSINLHGCTGLISLSLGNYRGTTLDVSTCTNLSGISTFSSNLLTLDFSNNLHFHGITGQYENLRYLNLKNGISQWTFMDTIGRNFNQPLYVCTDDFETAYVDSILSSRGWPNNVIVVNPFCTENPFGGDYNTISGTIKRDADHNGCDNADPVIIHVPVKITNASGISVMKYTGDPTGMYKYYDTIGSFTIRPYFPYPYYSVSPTSASASFSSVNNITATNDFCISSTGSHNKLDITIVPHGGPVPGFYTSYRIYYKNTGTTNLSGNVQFNYESNKMTLFAASGAPTQSAGQLSWNYNNLQPFETRFFLVQFLIVPQPVNNIGDTLMTLATINPVVGDETPWDNSFVLPQQVRVSYDPNYKECLQGEKLDIVNIGNPLDYVIHFQNLGTAPAANVVVTDTLSNHLDWESFDITGTSHPCDVQRKDNKLQFYFKDINLLDATSNEPASHGFVAFKIRPKSTVVIGDSLNNRASIYFDFNAPVVTNMATTIVSPTSSTPVKLEYFSLTAKNETNLLTWKAPATSGTTHFGIERSNDGIHFSNFGNITASVERCQLPFNFTDEKPFDGKTYYRLNIKDADGISFYSKVLMAGKTRSGLFINAVVSDRNNTTIYLNASKEQNVQMKIIAADGRLIYNQTKTIAAGNSTLNLPLKKVATGIYTLIVYTNDGEVITKRFVK
ncbi:MAG: T9SS type A sorting domain-containing protein [Ferruginibacter sp.]